MQVDGYHNYAANDGIILHNCDAIRYFAMTVIGNYSAKIMDKKAKGFM